MSTIVLPSETPQVQLDALKAEADVATLIVKSGTTGGRPLSKAVSAMQTLVRLELFDVHVSLPDLDNTNIKFISLMNCYGFNEAQLQSFKSRHPHTKVTVQFD